MATEEERELTAEERADRILGFLAHADDFNRKDILVTVITAAEQRGRQQAEAAADCSCGARSCPKCTGVAKAVTPAAPCPWADLQHLGGRALRERMRSRASTFRYIAEKVELEMKVSPFEKECVDLAMLIDHIYAAELPLTQEAERLWAEEAGGAAGATCREGDDVNKFKRFWVGWWSGDYADEGCTKPPFQFFVSGSRDDPNTGDDQQSLCALFDAWSGAACMELIERHFPDKEMRFCDEVSPDWLPGDRFPSATAYRVETTK